MPTKRLFALIFTLLFPLLAQAGDAPAQAPVCSAITVAPGDDLASLFGHTAIRIKDARLKDIFDEEDVWFDYGVFDPRDWTFWIHYAKGDAKYLLMAFHSEKRFNDYKEEGREVTEQVLDLTPEEVRKLENYLIDNLRHPEYEYRFLDDNCTTRAKGAIEWAKGEKFAPLVVSERNRIFSTYRNLTDVYLSRNAPVQLGANLFMGSHAERRADCFLPDNLHGLIAGNHSPKHAAPRGNFLFSIFASAFILLAIPTLLRHKKKSPLPRHAYLDAALFFSIGFLGCLMTFLGFWSHHPELGAFNWNLIWCWPTHLVFAFFLLFCAHGKTARSYARVAFVGSSCAALAYFFVPQALPVPLFPLVLLLAVRAWRWGWAATA